MSIPVRPTSQPVNRGAFAAGLLASASWHMWPQETSGAVQTAAAWAFAAIAGPLAVKTLVLLGRDYKLRRHLARTQAASTDHGTGRQAEWNEIVARRMDDPASGNFLGLFQGALPMFAPPRTPFSLVEIPPGGSKTIALVIGSILHQARLGKSLFIPDVKTELAPMLVAALRAMGIEVWCINPAKAYLDLCGDVEINLYQPVLDACHSTGEARKDSIKVTLDLAELHLPEEQHADKNVYFRNGSRRCIGIVILSQALLDPARCTPSDVFALLNDPAQFKKRLVRLRYEIERIFPGDPVAAFLKTEAANLLNRFAHNEENAAAFLEGATQRLLSFNQGGRMAGYGRTATRNIGELRKRQIVAFVMSPLSHARDFAPVVSLINHGLMEAAKREPAGHPVHIVGEEALNFRFNDIVSDMETMRGLKLSADFYIQSFHGLVRKYGREAAAAIEAYSDVKVYAGINSLERAKHVSDMLAEATIRRQDYSYKADVTDIGVSSREQARRLMTPDEILAMPRDEAWVFVRGMRPLRLTMANYGCIAPWRDEAATNPLEGPPLRGDMLFRIVYPDRAAPGARDACPKVADIARTLPQRLAKRRFVAPVRWRHLLWLPPLVALWSVDPLRFGTPHLRVTVSYVEAGSVRHYRQCDYVGVHPQTVFPAAAKCPLIAFLRAPGE